MPVDVQAVLATGGSDLKFLLAREGVSDEFQAKLFVAGVQNVRQFGVLASSTDDMRDLLKTEFELSTENGMGQRVQISKILVAWDHARQRSSKEAEAAAAAAVAETAKPLPLGEVDGMRSTFEKAWWKLSDDQMPGKGYLTKILGAVERDEPRAEPLTAVYAADLEEDEPFVPVCDDKGNLRTMRTPTTVALPVNTEELRTRIELMGTAWLMVSYVHTNRAWLQNQTPQLYADNLRYLLGKHVWGLVARDADGNTISTPSWRLVMAYEKEIRVEAMRLVKAGTPLVSALPQAWIDPVVKERHFTTPLALSAGRSGSSSSSSGSGPPKPSPPAPPPAAGPPTTQRQKRKALRRQEFQKKKRANTGFSTNGCPMTSPDGKRICYSFNNPDTGCKKANCSFVHICGSCFNSGHPMFQCRGAAKARAT